MHTLFERILLHVQMSIMPMEVDKDPKTCLEISRKPRHGFYSCVHPIMSPSHLLIYQQRQVQVSWWPFSPPCKEK